MTEWTREWTGRRTSGGVEYLDHRDGVAWADAPLPRRWHQCRPQTWGFIGSGGRPPGYVYRCACGAIALDRPDHWMNRNSRRKERRP